MHIDRAAPLARSPEQSSHRAWPPPIALATLIGLGSMAILLFQRSRLYWGFTLDDSFITLRYARHLADGLGPIWNTAAEPTEGYTTVLWMLVLAAAQAAGIDGLWFAKASGVVFALTALAVAARLVDDAARTAQLALWPRLLGLCALFAAAASYWPLALHAVSGMETTFSCLILTLFFFLSTRYQSDDATARRTWPLAAQLAFTALLCTLTRPEAALPCGATIAVHFVQQGRAARLPFSRQLAIWLLVPGAVYLLLRWRYFGLLFPLSFYVKATDQPWLTGLPDVVGFFRPFVFEQPWWALLFAVGAVRNRSVRPALIGSACFALFFIFPEHIMAFESRYMLPLFPLLAAVIGVGTAHAAHWAAERAFVQARQRFAACLGLATLLAAAWIPLPADATKRARSWLDYGLSLRKAHVALARDLAPARSAGGRIALLDVGAIGYYADWYTIDTFGLNDAHVALTKRRDIAYVLAKEPDLLVVVSGASGAYQELFEWETPLYASARARGYTPLCEYTFDPEYHLQVLSKPGNDTVRGHVCQRSTRRLSASAD